MKSEPKTMFLLEIREKGERVARQIVESASELGTRVAGLNLTGYETRVSEFTTYPLSSPNALRFGNAMHERLALVQKWVEIENLRDKYLGEACAASAAAGFGADAVVKLIKGLAEGPVDETGDVEFKHRVKLAQEFSDAVEARWKPFNEAQARLDALPPQSDMPMEIRDLVSQVRRFQSMEERP